MLDPTDDGGFVIYPHIPDLEYRGIIHISPGHEEDQISNRFDTDPAEINRPLWSDAFDILHGTVKMEERPFNHWVLNPILIL